MDEIARVVPQYAGISYNALEGDGIEWPCPSPGHPGTPVLHTGQFARGRGVFVPAKLAAPSEIAEGGNSLAQKVEGYTGAFRRRLGRGLQQ
jgi:formate dehydrogenase major subunit